MGESLFELKTVSQPVVFQDNIFFVETIMDKEENEYRTSIYSVDQKTKERVHWGDSGSANIGISISPNGKWLAYVSNNTKNKKRQLFLIGLKGGSAIQLTEEKQGITNYEWNSNGSGIYYQTAQKTEEKRRGS